MYHYRIICICAFVLVFSACKKKDSTATPSEILTSGSWLMTSYATLYISAHDSTEYELFNSFPVCIKDNAFIFSTNGTFIADEGTIKCGTQQIFEQGIYELRDNNRQLFLNPTTAGTSSGTYLFSINENEMIWEKDSIASSSIVKRTISKFIHKN